jgi:hypothetical protein
MSRKAQTWNVARLGIGAGLAMFLCCVVAPLLVVWAIAQQLWRITANRKEVR